MIGRRVWQSLTIVGALVGILAGASVATSCVTGSETTTSPEPPSTLAVEFSGCGEVWSGPICELPAGGELRLWLPVPATAELSVKAGEQQLPDAPRSAVQDGVLVRVEVPATERTLTVVARSDGKEARFQLVLRPPSASRALLSEAEQLRKSARSAEASAAASRLLDHPDARVRIYGNGNMARLSLRRGDAEAAVAGFEKALRLDRDAGLIATEFQDRLALTYAYLRHGRRFVDARRTLAPLETLGEAYPAGRATALYYEGLIAFETGDLRAALRLFREAEARAERLGLDAEAIHARTEQLDVLHAIGRDGKELRDELIRSLPTLKDPCEQAAMLSNLGWFGVSRERTLQRGSAGDAPAVMLTQAVAQFRRECPNPSNLAEALENLAMAELRSGDPESALQHVREARLALPSPEARTEVRLEEIEARVALDTGNPGSALRSFERMGRIADGAQLSDAGLQAALGQAEALDALGDEARAGEAYELANRLLEECARVVPLGKDRSIFLGNNEQISRHRVDFLMRRGMVEKAAEAARRSRSRALGALQWSARVETLTPGAKDQWETRLATYHNRRDALDGSTQHDWELPADRLAAKQAARRRDQAAMQAALDDALAIFDGAPGRDPRDDPPPARSRESEALPQPGEGELFLVFHPTREGWAGFALRKKGEPLQRRLDKVDPTLPLAALAEQLLLLFSDVIGDAERIRFLPYGALDAIDWHALPWKGRPLLSTAIIEYGVDLPGRVGKRPPPARPAALVVEDPLGDLVAARPESRRVTRSLEHDRGFRVALLAGADASYKAVRSGLAHPDLDVFHYAGHGVAAASSGLESVLLLAGKGSLSAADVLVLPRVPRHVVLSGCEMARTDDARVEGLGLAQAFVIAGASAVVASTRIVPDELAGDTIAAFYAAQASGDPEDPAASLREALRSSLGSTPALDWSSFRVLVP